MKTSLLLDKLATDLMFSIWACCKGQSTSSISTYQYDCTYWYVLVCTDTYLCGSRSSSSALSTKDGGPDPHQAHSQPQEHTSLTVLEALPHGCATHENLIHNAITFCLFMTLHTSTFQYGLVNTGMYWYVLVCTCKIRYNQVCTGMCRYVLAQTYLSKPYTGMYQYT